MADDLEGRVTELRIAVGSLQDKVQDHEGDIHRFGPLVTEQALLRQMAERELKSVGKSLDGAHEAIREVAERVDEGLAVLSQRIDEETRQRLAGQAERKAELEAAVLQRNAEMARMDLERDRQHQETRANTLKAAMALFGVFLAALASVVVQLISQGGTP